MYDFYVLLIVANISTKRSDKRFNAEKAFQGSNSTIGFSNSEEHLEQVSTEVNANFRLSLQSFTMKISPLDIIVYIMAFTSGFSNGVI